jgi:ubiquinone/menaquinone biosynthesis C-methylase UbiE
MTYFNPKISADKYAKGRPSSHDISIGRIKEFLKIDNKLDKALDIACGTGLSTKALLSIATKVYGTDISEEMINLAPSKDIIEYSVASAEKQPFLDNQFDLITVCAGVHWFNVDNFLQEVNRLLKNNGWLVLYSTYGLSSMTDEADFVKWIENVHVSRFPYPPSNYNYEWTNSNLKSKGFALQKDEQFETQTQLTKKQLVDYFTSQSNITQAVESGKENYNEIDAWLENELSVFYKNHQTREINFANPIKYLQKVG